MRFLIGRIARFNMQLIKFILHYNYENYQNNLTGGSRIGCSLPDSLFRQNQAG